MTPHITRPLSKNSTLLDRNILNIGMAHSGSWILKPTKQTITFINWWASRTLDRAKVDLCNGMFLDQLWLNYALSWIEESAFIDHPGWHVGLHSLPTYNVEIIGQRQLVGDQPLLTADFTGLVDYHPTWSNHINLLEHSKSFRKLLKRYHIEVSKQPLLATNSPAAFGQRARISPYRLQRKSLARVLRKITSFIDHF